MFLLDVNAQEDAFVYIIITAPNKQQPGIFLKNLISCKVHHKLDHDTSQHDPLIK